MMWSKILLAACFMLPLFDVGLAKCHNGWKYHMGHCYRFYRHPCTWLEAMEFCTIRGSSLVTINNSKENFWLRFRAVLYGRKFWIGGTDLFQSRIWRWESNAKRLQFKDFNPGEPNGLHERCLQFSSYKARWNDVPCNIKLSFICER